MSQQLDKTTFERRLLGWGVTCEPCLPLPSGGFDVGQDIVLHSGPRGKDLALVEGQANLAQDLIVAFTTLLGSDVFNLAFGFDGLAALAEETNQILARMRLRVSIIRLLQKEPRVRRVLAVEFEEGDPSVARRTRVLPARVEFETVSGDRVSMTLGEVGAHV